MKILIKKMCIFAALLALIAGLSACSKPKEHKDLLGTVKERGKIVAGVKFDSKPFGFIDADQQLKGFDVDLVREIAYRVLGSKDAVEFKQVNASNRIFSLTSGAIDLVAATMTITEKRKQIIDFSVPYFTAGEAIMVPKDSNIRNARELNGKKVIVVLGSTGEQNVRLLAPTAIIKGFRTYTEAYSALKAGRADALTTDDTIIAGLIMDDPGFIMLKDRYTKESYGVGFRKDNDSLEFENTVNSAIEDMIADGTIKKLENKWLHTNSKQ